MVQIIEDELWKNPGSPGMIVVTTNYTIDNGTLVMGCGAALEAKQRIPGIDKECAKAIWRAGRKPYGFLVVRKPVPEENRLGLGIFQTKEYFMKMAQEYLIGVSATHLTEYANANPDVNIRLNYPGIGYGSLTKGEVEPLLLGLPDNVTVCYRVPVRNFGIKDIFDDVAGYLQRGDNWGALQYMFRLGVSRDEAINQIRAVQNLLSEAKNASSRTERQQGVSEDSGVQQGRLL